MLRSRPSPLRARAGVSAMFFTNGAILSSLLPRYPEIKAGFALSSSQFGLLVVAMPLGAMLTAALAGVVIRRVGTLRSTAIGSVMLAAALALAGAAPQVWLFAAAMALAGALDAVVDAAQNVQGVVVEQWRGRSIMNSLHALWSLGAAVGGVIGAVSATAGIDLGAQMALSGALWAAVAVVASVLAVVPDDVRDTVRAEDPQVARSASPGVSARRHAWRLLVPLVALAICGTLVEDVASNWVVLYLGQEVGASTAVAGLGLSVVLGAQFVGRLLSDPLTDRWGREAVSRAGGLMIAGGTALAALAPAPALALVGFAVAGLGCAPLVPAAFAAAGRIPGLPEGAGIAAIGWLMRIGFLVTSPVIGLVTDATSLRVALALPVAAGLLAAALAHGTARADRTRTASAAGRP